MLQRYLPNRSHPEFEQVIVADVWQAAWSTQMAVNGPKFFNLQIHRNNRPWLESVQDEGAWRAWKTNRRERRDALHAAFVILNLGFGQTVHEPEHPGITQWMVSLGWYTCSHTHTDACPLVTVVLFCTQHGLLCQRRTVQPFALVILLPFPRQRADLPGRSRDVSVVLRSFVGCAERIGLREMSMAPKKKKRVVREAGKK